MTGKDWFILGIRLAGLGVLYFGIQEALAYIVRDVLFANIELSYFPQPNLSWSRLFHGAANVGIALLALTKAKKLADWCYGKDAPQIEHQTLQRDDGAAADGEFPADAISEREHSADKDYT